MHCVASHPNPNQTCFLSCTGYITKLDSPPPPRFVVVFVSAFFYYLVCNKGVTASLAEELSELNDGTDWSEISQLNY